MIPPFQLSQSKQTLINTQGHILTLGGPGSGKTTIALLKAKQIIEEGLKPAQRILFLSFARSTTARVAEQAKLLVDKTTYKRIEINTYHGFAWTILKSHGYLINKGQQIKLLPPPEAGARLASIKSGEREKEKQRLFTEEGLLHFDLFALFACDLLAKSKKLTKIFCDTYPHIILDEFQDTNKDEWNLIKLLGQNSRLIALADIDQRIYEFRGADPARVGEFIASYGPAQFDFGVENNRSNGTDIVEFGNDLLTGANKTKTYNNVILKRYTSRKGNLLHFDLKTEVLQTRSRLINSNNPNWTLAILVPTTKMMLNISEYLSTTQRFGNSRSIPPILHDLALDMAGPSLAAIAIAKLLEKGASDSELLVAFLNALYEHIRGRNGDKTQSVANLATADSIQKFLTTGKVNGKNKKRTISEAEKITSLVRSLKFSGEPGADWITVRNFLDESDCPTIQQVAQDAIFLRLLRKGAILNSGLASLWKSNGNYNGATRLVRTSLVQDHFSGGTTIWKGIHVMTIHKSKGKEFDEVIIYEGVYGDRIARSEDGTPEFNQSKLALRVGITRAVRQSMIVSPRVNICPFW